MPSHRTSAALAGLVVGAVALAATAAIAGADDEPEPTIPSTNDVPNEVRITEQDLDREGNPIGPARTYDGDGDVVSGGEG